MAIAERIYEVVKDLSEATAAEVLNYAETKRTREAMAAQTARRAAALALLDKHAGRFRAMRLSRAELYAAYAGTGQDLERGLAGNP